MKKTLIIGATNNPGRYAYKAANRLVEAGHEIVPFGIKKGEVAGIEMINDWQQFEGVDTVTMYVGAPRQDEYIDKIISINPKRVIFNPGTENPIFEEKLKAANIEAEIACTLVLLSMNSY
jgi:predicted CoA-binding protein